MQEVITFAFLGLGLGALYSLAAQGLVLIYRGSGVLNFAHGAIGMAGAYIYWSISVDHGHPFVVGLIAGVAASAVIGAATHLLVMRPLRQASPLARVVATLGILITLQSLVVLVFTTEIRFVPSTLPVDSVSIGGVKVSTDRIYLLVIAVVLAIALWALYKFTKFGVGTAAVAENQRSAATLGWSPDVIATANWALGSALAGVAAILIIPIVTLQVSVLTNMVLAALAAALIASFRSFPIALVASLVIGVAEVELTRYVQQPGLGTSVPFILIVVFMVARGQTLPMRDYFLQRLPAIGDGRVKFVYVAAAVVVGVLAVGFTPVAWQDGFTITMATALILLSLVVVTGYTGQLSLAQFALAGFGAWIAGRLVADQGWPFWAGALAGVLGTVPLGLAFVLPAVRTRGINFAVVTLGLGSTLELMLFLNSSYTGDYRGTQIDSPHLFGIDIGAISHPARYGYVTLAVLIVGCLAVANVRRGRSGRRLIAVRTNERAAAALGISVQGAKLYAFGLAAALAAAGGILLAFRNTSISYATWTSFESISAVAWAMIGGIGFIMGPIFGATLAPGGLGTVVGDRVFAGIAEYVPLITGVLLIVLVLMNQHGIAKETGNQIRWVRGKLGKSFSAIAIKPEKPVALPAEVRAKVDPRVLKVSGLTVTYGVTVAVDEVSLAVTPGKIVGLIGPNGAGKTTLIDAITGFAKVSDGTIELDTQPINKWSVIKRSRQGLSRSFQSLELFEDSTVIDNLRVASDPRDLFSYVRDLVLPTQPELPGEVVAAIKEFGLEADLQTKVEDLPYGKRRLLAIARAVATTPSVLLLDEPAAGLGDAETAELASLVRRLAADWGMAVLLVEHDMNFVMSVCDEIVVLDFGKKIAEGTPAQVRNNPAVIAAYLGETTDELIEDPTVSTPPAVTMAGTSTAKDGF
ncbi:ABC transporter permease subunit [Williamsia soli]|uniref:ABC transporter permease subunit n=1 Tax=Williamsia soli TaxID=364929 RepID=UPI001A9D966A|nr:ATP-binding cassette domain-containing protein [Williamsia soli]